ncbi:MAG: bifunctional 4-hydroxy-2-oxoglutarate aldolase/2-dehydro-3-deoxy-phosphogluconate aldolase [Erysipelotrichaceae bacterium]
MNEIVNLLKKVKVLPLLTIKDMKDAKKIGECLVEGGVPIVEVAFRSQQAAEGIKELNKISNLIVGAGTVCNLKDAKSAVENGAKFIVTPGLVEEVIVYANELNIPVFPGAVTPSEIIYAKNHNLKCVKFFPADNYGGIKTLKALHGPFGDITFLPTGGIDINNYKEYLELDYVTAVGGSFVVPNKYVEAKDWEGLTKHILSL